MCTLYILWFWRSFNPLVIASVYETWLSILQIYNNKLSETQMPLQIMNIFTIRKQDLHIILLKQMIFPRRLRNAFYVQGSLPIVIKNWETSQIFFTMKYHFVWLLYSYMIKNNCCIQSNKIHNNILRRVFNSSKSQDIINFCLHFFYGKTAFINYWQVACYS